MTGEGTPGRSRDMPMVDVVRLQQEACERAGSLLYGRVLRGVVEDLHADGVCAAVLRPWSANALADAVPLRFLAAVHRIVLEGGAPELAAHYPSAGGAEHGDPVPAFLATVARHRARIEAEMGQGVQTNEVGRAASLLGGFHRVSIEHRLPLRVLEVGASAGLLLRWDRYGYRAPGLAWGGDEEVRFEDPWVDDAPELDPHLQVASRAGCDISPIDVSTDDGVVRLRGFLWPDQVERRARLDAAIEVARRHPAPVERADAGEWVADQLRRPAEGVATVVYHSIVLQYLSRPSFDLLRRSIVEAGERATPDAPVSWLRMEPAGELADVRLRRWPGGEDEWLGTTGYHGPPVRWCPGGTTG